MPLSYARPMKLRLVWLRASPGNWNGHLFHLRFSSFTFPAFDLPLFCLGFSRFDLFFYFSSPPVRMLLFRSLPLPTFIFSWGGRWAACAWNVLWFLVVPGSHFTSWNRQPPPICTAFTILLSGRRHSFDFPVLDWVRTSAQLDFAPDPLIRPTTTA